MCFHQWCLQFWRCAVRKFNKWVTNVLLETAEDSMRWWEHRCFGAGHLCGSRPKQFQPFRNQSDGIPVSCAEFKGAEFPVFGNKVINNLPIIKCTSCGNLRHKSGMVINCLRSIWCVEDHRVLTSRMSINVVFCKSWSVRFEDIVTSVIHAWRRWGLDRTARIIFRSWNYLSVGTFTAKS